ncbi:MAG TPA: hypothetical protein VE442_03055 [Jatrophihabitans sp.]|jgi:hypothetical protein|nr:hypothetical protein [Jatrophihabitans sp.]
MSRTEPLVPDRWAHEVGRGMLLAAFVITLLALPDGSRTFSPVAVFYALVAGLLIIGGVRLLRRERW